MSAALSEHVIEQCHCTPCRLHALDDFPSVLAGPHSKTLVDGAIVIEPLAFVPVSYATGTDHRGLCPPANHDEHGGAPTSPCAFSGDRA